MILGTACAVWVKCQRGMDNTYFCYCVCVRTMRKLVFIIVSKH